jgi:hypothetical protein
MIWWRGGWEGVRGLRSAMMLDFVQFEFRCWGQDGRWGCCLVVCTVVRTSRLGVNGLVFVVFYGGKNVQDDT